MASRWLSAELPTTLLSPRASLWVGLADLADQTVISFQQPEFSLFLSQLLQSSGNLLHCYCQTLRPESLLLNYPLLFLGVLEIITDLAGQFKGWVNNSLCSNCTVIRKVLISCQKICSTQLWSAKPMFNIY